MRHLQANASARGARRQRGLSLLELLVAFTIMAISLGVLYGAMGSSARSIGQTEQWQQAVALGQSILAARQSVTEEGWNETGRSGAFVWQVQSKPYGAGSTDENAPPLHEVLVTIHWTDNPDSPNARVLELHTLRVQRRPYTDQEMQL